MGEGHFEVLDAAECSLLLREASVGRLAFDGPDGLTVLPLSYALDDERIVLRTGGQTQLASLADGTPVAFEVDEFDPACRNGWSVVARGSLGRPAEGELTVEAGPEPFVPDTRELLLVISDATLTGRAVAAA
ncbi:pyridoxamine 5'-phosphate oxidase family protein [Luteococcus sp. H138]|uniref:pyridoxamine 5'-phosphate oxidase family protein n=1 Tax=unclassified Luteococcus TaxID=2639923 RepID=UPI00313C33A2